MLGRLSNYLAGRSKSFLFSRSSLCNSTQVCTYSKKSPEDHLGIEKPKRPMNTFIRFMNQIRPTLMEKHPGISNSELIIQCSKLYKELDEKSKEQLREEYYKEIENYKKNRALYESTLTEEMKVDIMKMRETMAASKKLRKIKAELKDLGKPKRPMSSYFLFCQSRPDLFHSEEFEKSAEKAKTEWKNLPEGERRKFEEQAKALYEKYKKDLETWESEMIILGRTDVIRAKSIRKEITQSSKKGQ